jgi:UDP-N-acetylmuramate dehydrogenase
VTSARDPAFLDFLRKRVRGTVREGDSLARHSTYRIGGPATVFNPADADDVTVALAEAHRSGVDSFVLGLGSNVLLPDEGMDALVIRPGKGLQKSEQVESLWRFGAGLPAPLVARRTADAGWAGLEMMVGVPGTVGGGVYMNAGCHGGQWADVVQRVWVANRQGAVIERAGSDIPFRYRRSGLGDLIVLETEVELRQANPGELADAIARHLSWRQAGTPFNQPCCGSVFKNPTWSGEPPGPNVRTAGQLIEASGLKGYRIGGVIVSPMHANYVVNTGDGTAADVRGLMTHVRRTVLDRYGIDLEPEVKVIGVRGEWLEEGATDE